MDTSREVNKLQIEPPTNCPSCDSLLEWLKDQLYCRNLNCPAKSSKQVQHFAKTLKIKGLGPSTIDKLELTSVLEIYELDEDTLETYLGSEKIAASLLSEIERSKSHYLNVVLPAFGIPLIGESATDKLSSVAQSIFDIDETLCKKAGLGPVATNNLLTWLENEFDKYCELPFSFEFAKQKRSTESRGVVCITGKLSSYPTKAAATEILENLGYTVKSSLTKDVTILVNESGVETAKTIKAANDGVEIVTNLKTFIGE